MKRLRLAMLLLSAALLVPLGLLVQKARASLDAERAMERLAIAERIFDEMERELTALLRREEDRPYGHYRYLHRPTDAPASQAPALSPLAGQPAEAYVVGYFQVEPDGAVTSPRVPGNEELASSYGWQTDPEASAAERRVKELVAAVWKARPEPVAYAAGSQAAGSTVSYDELKKMSRNKDGGRQAKEAEEADGAPVEQMASQMSQSETLGRLNRGASERRERAAKVAKTERENVYDFSNSMRDVVAAGEAAGGVSYDADKAGAPAAAAVQQRASSQELAAATVDVRLAPRVGRAIDSDHLVLYRTVMLEGLAYRQGLVLDQRLLLAELADRVLTTAGLTRTARITSAGSPPATPAGWVRFQHRYAEPFGAVVSVLDLEPPLTDGSGYLNLLSGLLVMTATLGLFAVYRMVAVVVGFSERRSNFVSAVSHELKTPLTAIRMYGEMLRDGIVASDEKRQRYYGIITTESERLTRLVNNVLELGRLERRSRPLSLVEGDLKPLIDEVVGVIGPHAAELGFELRVDLAADLPRARLDRDALMQVLFNLVDNALKYAGAAQEKIVRIECRANGDRVELTVRDRGPGVAKRHLRHVFQPFYRGEDELTRRSQGTGIGLALVHGLVEQMGGRVRGRNGAEGGFVVTVSLAAARGTAG